MPGTRPVLGDLFVARNGEVWVQPDDANASMRTTFERFDANGRQLATVTVPVSIVNAVITAHASIRLLKSAAPLYAAGARATYLGSEVVRVTESAAPRRAGPRT